MHLRLLAVLLVLSFGVRRAAAAASPRRRRQPGTRSGAAARLIRRRPRPWQARSVWKARPGQRADPHERRSGVRAANKANADTGDVRQRGGRLGNVFVYVQSGLTGTFPAPTTPVRVRSAGCRYHPHVFGVQVGQPIEIVNSDATLHNIHAMPKTNAEFNTASRSRA
jgi:plastocyanin